MTVLPRESRLKFWRILKIDEYIRQGSGLSAKVIAQKLEVSSRTVERDIEFLRDMYNAPIKYNSREKRYYYTEPSFFLKSLFLSESDFFSIAIIEKVLQQYKNTPIEQKLKAIFSKLTALLPDTMTIPSMWVDDSVTFVADSTPNIASEIFTTVFEGVKTRTSLSFLYRNLQQSQFLKRIIDPYHVVCQKGHWYILGFCHTKQEIRIFSFSRMKNIILLHNDRFCVPKDFAPHKYIDKNIGVWGDQQQYFLVRLLFSPKITTFAEERIWAENQTIKTHSNGSVEVTFQTNQRAEIKRFILGQGATVKVLEPSDLIDEIKQEIHIMQKVYE